MQQGPDGSPRSLEVVQCHLVICLLPSAGREHSLPSCGPRSRTSVFFNFRAIVQKLKMLEGGREAITEVQNAVAELLEELSRREHLESPDGEEARQTGESQ